jgi:nitroreductase
MTTLNGPDVIERLKWRYAVKKFDATRKVSDADWKVLEQALVLAPSSYGLQPFKFLVIDSPKVRKQLTPAAWGQSQVEACSHYVVFAAKRKITEADVERFVARTASVRGAPVASLKGYQDMMVGDLVKGPRAAWIDQWSARQAYIALGTLMTTAAALGIDTCPMEGFVPDQFDEILGLTKGDYRSVVSCAVGYRSTEDGYGKLAKVRFPVEDLVVHV